MEECSKLNSAAPRIGRPPRQAARSHAAIMDAVYELLQETSARDLTMEAVAKRAGVGKPTLYKWWPSKAALIMAMFNERLVGKPVSSSSETVEELLRLKLRRLVQDFNGLFGKVMAELIGEGQTDPELLKDLHEHISKRRIHTVADIERGARSGEFLPGTDAELAVDILFGPAYYRLLLGFPPLTRQYADHLVDQILCGLKGPDRVSTRSSKSGNRRMGPELIQPKD